MYIRFLDESYKMIEVSKDGIIIEAFNEPLFIPYEVLNEAQTEAPLYRVLGPNGCMSAIKKNIFDKRTSYGICFTRNKNYWIGDLDSKDPTKIFQFRINQSKLTSDYKLLPIAEPGYEPKDNRSEYEERILGDVENVDRYLECIEVRKGRLKPQLKSLKNAIVRYNKNPQNEKKIKLPIKLTEQLVVDVEYYIKASGDGIGTNDTRLICKAVAVIVEKGIKIGPYFKECLEELEISNTPVVFSMPKVTTNHKELEKKVKEIQAKVPKQPDADPSNESPLITHFKNQVGDIESIAKSHGYRALKITPLNYDIYKTISVPFNKNKPSEVDFEILYTPSDLLMTLKFPNGRCSEEACKYLGKVYNGCYRDEYKVMLNQAIDYLTIDDIFNKILAIEKDLNNFEYPYHQQVKELGGKLLKDDKYKIAFKQLDIIIENNPFKLIIKIKKGNSNVISTKEFSKQRQSILDKYNIGRESSVEYDTTTIPNDFKALVEDVQKLDDLLVKAKERKFDDKGKDIVLQDMNKYILANTEFERSYSDSYGYTTSTDQVRFWVTFNELTYDIEVVLGRMDYNNIFALDSVTKMPFYSQLEKLANYQAKFTIKYNKDSVTSSIDTLCDNIRAMREIESGSASDNPFVKAVNSLGLKLKSFDNASDFIHAYGVINGVSLKVAFYVTSGKIKVVAEKSDLISQLGVNLDSFADNTKVQGNGSKIFILEDLTKFNLFMTLLKDYKIELSDDNEESNGSQEYSEKQKIVVAYLEDNKGFKLEKLNPTATILTKDLGWVQMKVLVHQEDATVGITFKDECLQTHQDYISDYFTMDLPKKVKSHQAIAKGFQYRVELHTATFNTLVLRAKEFNSMYEDIPKVKLGDAVIKDLKDRGFTKKGDSFVKYLDLYQLETFVWDDDDPAHITTFIEFVDAIKQDPEKVEKIKGIFKILDKSYSLQDYDEDGVEIDCPCNVGKLAAILDTCEIFNTNNKDAMLPSNLVQDDEMQEAIKDLLDLNKVQYTETKNRYRVKNLGGLGVETILYKNGAKFIFKIPKSVPGFNDLLDSFGLEKHTITMGDDMAYIECFDLDIAAEIFETILEYNPEEEITLQKQLEELLTSIKFEVDRGKAIRQLDNLIVELNLVNIEQDEIGMKVYYNYDANSEQLPKLKKELQIRIQELVKSHSHEVKYSTFVFPVDNLSKALVVVFDFDKDIKEILSTKNPSVNAAQEDGNVTGAKYQVRKGDIALNILPPMKKGQIWHRTHITKSIYVGVDDTIDEMDFEVLSVLKSGKVKCKNLNLGIEFKLIPEKATSESIYFLVKDVEEKPKKAKSVNNEELEKELLVNGAFKEALQLLKENGYEVSEDESYASHYGNVITVDMDCNKEIFTAYVSPVVGLKDEEVDKLIEIIQGNLKNVKVDMKVMSTGMRVSVPLNKLKDVIDVFNLTNKTFMNFLNFLKDKEVENAPSKAKDNVKGARYNVHKGDIALDILPPMKKGQIWHRTRIIKSIYVGVDDIIEEMDFEVLGVLKSGKVKCKNLKLGIEFKLIPEKTNNEDTYFLVKDVEEKPKKAKPINNEEPSIIEEPPVIEKEPKLQPNKAEEIPTKTRKGDLIGRVYDLKFKKTGEEDHDDAIDRILAYIKKNQKVLKTRNDLGIWLLDSPKELAKYKLEFPAVVLMFYGDMTADMVKKDPIYTKFHKSKALSVIRHPFKTKDLNGVPVMAAVFYDNKTAVKYHLKLIKESIENNTKIELNGVEFKVLGLNEHTIEIESNSGVRLEVLIESLNIPMQDDIEEE